MALVACTGLAHWCFLIPFFDHSGSLTHVFWLPRVEALRLALIWTLRDRKPPHSRAPTHHWSPLTGERNFAVERPIPNKDTMDKNRNWSQECSIFKNKHCRLHVSDNQIAIRKHYDNNLITYKKVLIANINQINKKTLIGLNTLDKAHQSQRAEYDYEYHKSQNITDTQNSVIIA